MEVRNSSGHRVSLLNDSCAEPDVASARTFHQFPPPVKLPTLTTSVSSAHSPTNSSTACNSPQTPPLVRSESSDSGAFASPSPLTPHSTSFEAAQLPHSKHSSSTHHQSFYIYRQPSWSHKMEGTPDWNPLLPENTTITGFPLPTPGNAMPQARIRTSTSPESRLSNASVASATAAAQAAPKPATKKNQYPCPLAKQYQCNDHFTTSGHAARHAKKHTGRKDAICPECNKAFTRKDNMEQHRRTHQNMRGPSKNAENRVKKPSKPSRKSEKSEKAASPRFDTAINAHLDEQASQMALHDPTVTFSMQTDPSLQQTLLPPAGGPYFGTMNADPISALPQPMPMGTAFDGRPQLYRTGYSNTLPEFNMPLSAGLNDGTMNQYPDFDSPNMSNMSNGLNTLALAASGHGRLSELHQRTERPVADRTDSESSSTKSAAATP